MMMNKLIAEWERQEAVILAWPHECTDWNYMLDEAIACYVQIASAIASKSKLIIVAPHAGGIPDDILNRPNVKFYQIQTNDTWARDFGFLSCSLANGLMGAFDFKFNGWGLKFASDKDNLVTSNLRKLDCFSDDVEYVNRLSFVLEGGSVETDGNGTLLTTSECLLSPNRNGGLTKESIQRQLSQDFGCSNMLWLDHGFLAGDDTDSHIDTLARLLPSNVIAYSTCDRTDDLHYHELHEMQLQLQDFCDNDGKPFRLIPFPIPNPIFDEEGQRLPATYVNFLLLNGAVLLPIYRDEHYDKIAIENIKCALPTYEVITIDCSALIRQHGSLHCVTMQVPPGILKQ